MDINTLHLIVTGYVLSFTNCNTGLAVTIGKSVNKQKKYLVHKAYSLIYLFQKMNQKVGTVNIYQIVVWNKKYNSAIITQNMHKLLHI